MNKSDKILLIIITIIILVICCITFSKKSDLPKKAMVYYQNDLVLSIDLTDDSVNTYEVDGLLGKVVIEKNGSKVRVIEENSPNHICSKQGYIEESYEVLICLPNKIVIKIEDEEKIDTIVK